MKMHKIVKILLKKKTAESIIPSFLDYEYGRINIFYRGCKEACSYCKQEGHGKSGCEILSGRKNKFSKKITNSEENITTKANSSEFKAEDKVIESPDAESTVTDTIESDNISPPVRRRGTVGLKRPPSYSVTMVHIEQTKKFDPNNVENNTKSEYLDTEILKISENKTKKIISSDDETPKFKAIKNLINLSSSLRICESDIYSPPTELDRMAQKARIGEITEEQYIIFQKEYVLKNFTQSEVEMDSCTDDGDGLVSSETHSQMETDTDL
ncbi:hypothetical protein AYI70_g11781 [Smittium culicis]|uniref:Uncharacterized protein n=1 Tax=Smittium culicis TaxID=133412 RepID=A0A1R1X0C7_9FUNG|nr:hypothetical protein AYI70_g12158 [Smittium culicis]OMJ08069.1 hypothetical protein AYI70_g11781 [Smittium culicis]